MLKFSVVIYSKYFPFIDQRDLKHNNNVIYIIVNLLQLVCYSLLCLCQ